MQQASSQCSSIRSAIIALGANLRSSAGAPRKTVADAMTCIKTAVGPITGKSAMYLTPSYPAGNGPDYVNAVIVAETSLTSAEILAHLHEIEQFFGRERTARWGQRTLDLDLLAMGGDVVPDVATYQTWRHLPLGEQQQKTPDQLILPHPRLQDRAFVLVPMADVAPGWVHPVLRRSVLEMRDALPQADLAAVRRLGEA